MSPPAPPVVDQAPLEHARERLWAAVRRIDEAAAVRLVRTLFEDGVGADTILLEVIAPVQRRLGDEWARGAITVASEHAATAINERIVAALAHHSAPSEPVGRGRVTLSCVEGEWHAFPARLVSELLGLRGWRVDYLGAPMPTPYLVAHLHQTMPVTVGLSCSIASRLPAAHVAITACQAVGIPVIVGGAAFGADGRYARQLGADAWAPDARTAADRIEAGFPVVRDRTARLSVDDLPHLADQEYTLVRRNSADLVRGVLRAAVAAAGPPPEGRPAEAVEHLVTFLATALYLDDAGVFDELVSWTADVDLPDGLDRETRGRCLVSLADQLVDFPRALRLLRSAWPEL